MFQKKHKEKSTINRYIFFEGQSFDNERSIFFYVSDCYLKNLLLQRLIKSEIKLDNKILLIRLTATIFYETD